MRPWQVKLLLVLLVGNFLFCNIALNYLSMPAGSSQSDKQVFLVWMGILVAQPALLAIWAAFGSESLFVRLPRAVFLVSLVALTVTFGTWLNLAGRLDEDSLAMILSPFCQFAFLLLSLWPIRFFRNWRIIGSKSSEGWGSSPENRFSLKRLFLWQCLIAVVLLTGLFLFRDSWIDGSQGFPFETFGEGAVVGLTFCFFSLPIVFLLGATLGRKRKVWHALASICSASIFFGVAMLALYVAQGKLDPSDSKEMLAVLVSFNVVSLVALFVIRLTGYRLERVSDEKCMSTSAEFLHSDPVPRTRFAIAVGALALLFLAMCPYAMGLHEQRIARAKDQKWLNLGIKVNQWNDGSISDVSFLVRKPILDDALTALGGCPQLKSVNLGSSQILERQIELVGELASVETLVLNNTKVSDIGLQHLSRLQRLRFLHLQMCPRVTAAGVRKLQMALPNCRIVFP